MKSRKAAGWAARNKTRHSNASRPTDTFGDTGGESMASGVCNINAREHYYHTIYTYRLLGDTGHRPSADLHCPPRLHHDATCHQPVHIDQGLQIGP